MNLDNWRLANVNMLICETYRAIHSESNNIVFVIGGLGSNYGNISAEKVFSKALGNNLPSEIYKLKNPISSHKGYVIRKDGQIIVLLPDEPTEISEIFRCGLSDYFKSAVNK